jgi:Icc-related predicted phosphoesterase
VKRIVACSDTHGKHLYLPIPEGDVFIFAGDFEIRNTFDLIEMSTWLNNLPHKNVVAIFGNHDFTEHYGNDKIKEMFGRVNLLFNESITVDGFKIWGSPYSPYFNNWAWMQPDNMLAEIWATIPLETEIVVTHTMPYGILDQCGPRMESVGSLTLTDRIKVVHPYIQIGGHLHESYGQYTDGKTDYYNVSVMDEQYKIVNPVTIIEV